MIEAKEVRILGDVFVCTTLSVPDFILEKNPIFLGDLNTLRLRSFLHFED